MKEKFWYWKFYNFSLLLCVELFEPYAELWNLDIKGNYNFPSLPDFDTTSLIYNHLFWSEHEMFWYFLHKYFAKTTENSALSGKLSKNYLPVLLFYCCSSNK